MAGCLLAGFACAAQAASDRANLDPAQFTALADGIPHPTVGCNGAVVLTPRPGTEFADPLGNTPDSATSFYAKAASLHMKWASTMHCTHTGDTDWPIPGQLDDNPDSGSQTTGNYSGYRIDKTSEYVQSGWTIPTVVNPPPTYHYSPNGYYASSTWTGIGGGHAQHPDLGNLPLIQAGSRQDFTAPSTGNYYFWWEIVGGPSESGEVKFDTPPVAHPGDDVGATVFWFPDTDNTEFGMCDFTDANPPPYGCVQMELVCDHVHHPEKCTAQPGGNTTEWIVEAPNDGYGSYYLSDFGEVNFYNGCWTDTLVNGVPSNCRAISKPGVTSPTAYDLYQAVFQLPAQLLAYPDGITSGSSFTDLFRLPDRGN